MKNAKTMTLETKIKQLRDKIMFEKLAGGVNPEEIQIMLLDDVKQLLIDVKRSLNTQNDLTRGLSHKQNELNSLVSDLTANLLTK